LAGGAGERVRRLLPAIPKPMAPAAGRPFLEWVIRYLAAQGVTEIVVSTCYLAETISRHVAGLRIDGVALSCAEEPRALGTAGGFLNAIAGRPPGAPWLVCNGDSLALTALDPLYDALARPSVDAAILGVHMQDASRYGSLHEEGGLLRRFLEKQPGSGLINAGVLLLSPGFVGKYPERRPLSLERDVIPPLLEAGARIQVCAAAAPFLDIGTEATLPQADRFIAENARFFRNSLIRGLDS